MSTGLATQHLLWQIKKKSQQWAQSQYAHKLDSYNTGASLNLNFFIKNINNFKHCIVHIIHVADLGCGPV